MTWFAWRPREPGSDGRLAGIFLIGYALSRSFVELFREPDAHLGYLVGGLTMGQLLSLPMIVLGALLVLRSYGRARASLERS
jgi:phosphatidylglycerol:prolipoprotein diacylglycerol transferase